LIFSLVRCGETVTGGEFCNLSCRSELAEKSETRAAKHARMGELVQNLCRIAPEPIALDFLGD
jgi:hypothetical protein